MEMTAFEPRSPEQAASFAQLVFNRNPDALAKFYDERAGRVREYCVLACQAPLIEEATFAAFIDFLGRLTEAGPEADLDDLLRKATRSAAAGRAEVRVETREVVEPARHRRSARKPAPTAGPGPICQAMPELLAAYANGELAGHEQLDEHLAGCSVCRTTATRFRRSESAFTREPSRAPDEEIRRVWLEIAVRGAPQNDAQAGRRA
jgi:anti-sigma factor RsiW